MSPDVGVELAAVCDDRRGARAAALGAHEGLDPKKDAEAVFVGEASEDDVLLVELPRLCARGLEFCRILRVVETVSGEDDRECSGKLRTARVV